MNEYQKEYLEVWTEAFFGLLGWTDEQTYTWAQPFLAGMDPPGMVITEPPLFYVAREIFWMHSDTHSDIDSLSQSVQFKLIRSIQKVLSPHHERKIVQGFDFGLAKKQIDKLVYAARQNLKGGGS